MENNQLQSAGLTCILCQEQAIELWPAIDSDMPSNPYCRQCLDETKLRVLEVLIKDKKDLARNKEAQQRLERVKNVNLIIEKIASLGRNFFKHKDKIAKLTIDPFGKIWYECEYIGSTGRTRFCLSTGHPLQTREWYHGGTLQGLILDFKHYIHFGGHPNGKNGYGGLYCPHWGYSEADMKEIQNYARELGYLKPL